jgi:hypothetical protein
MSARGRGYVELSIPHLIRFAILMTCGTLWIIARNELKTQWITHWINGPCCDVSAFMNCSKQRVIFDVVIRFLICDPSHRLIRRSTKLFKYQLCWQRLLSHVGALGSSFEAHYVLQTPRLLNLINAPSRQDSRSFLSLFVVVKRSEINR